MESVDRGYESGEPEEPALIGEQQDTAPQSVQDFLDGLEHPLDGSDDSFDGSVSTVLEEQEHQHSYKPTTRPTNISSRGANTGPKHSKPSQKINPHFDTQEEIIEVREPTIAEIIKARVVDDIDEEELPPLILNSTQQQKEAKMAFRDIQEAADNNPEGWQERYLRLQVQIKDLEPIAAAQILNSHRYSFVVRAAWES